ncbi:hypothetical protein D3C73_1576960 [compost metagenome]
MHALEIARLLIMPAAGMVHRTGRVIGLEPFRNVRGIELSPGFIERNPHPDARDIVQCVHHLF